MLKNILKLNGAQQLTSSEQKTISGGDYHNTCNSEEDCGPREQCICGECLPMGDVLPPC